MRKQLCLMANDTPFPYAKSTVVQQLWLWWHQWCPWSNHNVQYRKLDQHAKKTTEERPRPKPHFARLQNQKTAKHVLSLCGN